MEISKDKFCFPDNRLDSYEFEEVHYLIWKYPSSNYVFINVDVPEIDEEKLTTVAQFSYNPAVPYIRVRFMENELVVRNVAVPEGIRRKGVATKMLAATIERFKPEKLDIESPGEDSIPWWDMITKKYSASQIEVVPISDNCRKQEVAAQKTMLESLKDEYPYNKK